MASGIEWAGSAAKRNCLADEEGAFDTRVPSTALGIRVEDDLVWSDEPPALQKKRAKTGFLIEEDSLKENADLRVQLRQRTPEGDKQAQHMHIGFWRICWCLLKIPLSAKEV